MRPQRPTLRARARLPLTEERKRAFLEHLATYGIAVEAARAASPGCPSGAMATFKDARRRDPEFAAAWEEAAEQARGVIEAEIRRRAIEGWEEPGRNGPVRKYSDRLLELMARARLPEYRDQ